MIAESIKTLLGAELTAQVEAALKGKAKDNKDVDLVIGNDGSHVPAEKHEQEKARAQAAEAVLKSAAETMKGIGGSGDPQKLAADVEAAKKSVADLTAAHKTEMTKIQKTTAIKLALSAVAHDPNDIISLLDMDKVTMDDKGNLLTNMDELIKPIKESKPYMFKAADTGANDKDKGKQADNPGFVPIGGKPSTGGGGEQKPANLFDAISQHYASQQTTK